MVGGVAVAMRRSAIVLLGMLTIVGCSSPERAAEELIENDFANEYGLIEMEAECDEASKSNFNCVSTSEIGVIEWRARVRDNSVSVRPINLLDDDYIDRIVSAATAFIKDTSVIQVEGLDCGRGPLVVERAAVGLLVPCELTYQHGGESHDVDVQVETKETVSLAPLGQGENGLLREFNVQQIWRTGSMTSDSSSVAGLPER